MVFINKNLLMIYKKHFEILTFCSIILLIELNLWGVISLKKKKDIIDKLLKQGRKGKLDALIKASSNDEDEIRAAAATAMGYIKTYESGMALIPLLRDPSPLVRASAATSVAEINAKHCEEYVKKLAFADSDPTVRECAREAFDKLRTRVV